MAMTCVSKEDFYRLMWAMNVHPTPNKTNVEWIDQRTRATVGISTPGYLCDGPASFRVLNSIANNAAVPAT